MKESVVGDIAMLKNKHKSMGPLPIIRLITTEIRQHKRNRFTRFLSNEPAKAEPRSKVASAASKKFVLSIVIMLILVAANTFLAKVVMDQSYNLIQMKKQEAALIDKNVTLRIDVSRLKSPNRIASIASKKLGLNTARENIYVNINVPPKK
mgnify:CR=1 FL=1